jgi:hypothetical protein
LARQFSGGDQRQGCEHYQHQAAIEILRRADRHHARRHRKADQDQHDRDH